MVQLRDRVTLAVDDETHRIPGQVDWPLLRLGIPVARIAKLSLAILTGPWNLRECRLARQFVSKSRYLRSVKSGRQKETTN
jgi:hypothetical protein